MNHTCFTDCWIICIMCTFSLYVSIHNFTAQQSCAGPPFLYATTHDEVPNILKFSRDGCMLSSSVLLGGLKNDVELRTMAFGKYEGNDVLYVVDANADNSKILIYGACDEQGNREFIKTAVSAKFNQGANHGYGLCLDKWNNLYASFQHTDVVLRFSADTFKELPIPPTIRETHHWREYYEGTFVQFGHPKVHDTNEQGVRAITIVDEDTIWIANEDLNGIAVASLSTGLISNIIVIHNPISLYFDKDLDIVFASSKQKHWNGAVYAIGAQSMRILREYKDHRMSHPSGISRYNNILYVAELTLGLIMTFNIDNGEYLGNILEDAPGELEHLLLSYC